MRSRSMAIAFLLLGLFVSAAQASVPRVIILEKLGATW